MISHNLTLGAVPGGVDVAGLGHLPEEAEVLHDELLERAASGGNCKSASTIALVSFPVDRPMSKPSRRTCAK